MATLRVDIGAVENSNAFMASCHSINSDLGIGVKGLEINPANIEMPGQNPVERRIQTLDNIEAAITADQDLLGSEFWGLASLTVAKTLNHLSNPVNYFA